MIAVKVHITKKLVLTAGNTEEKHVSVVLGFTLDHIYNRVPNC